MIEIGNISKVFGDRKIISEVSMYLETGKVNMVIGQSGAGKSVLLKCLVGLVETDGGEIWYDGRNFTDMDYEQKKELRKEIGMLFQGGALFDSLTVEENVAFPLEMFTNMSKSERLDRANFCLKRVNLPNSNKLFPDEISGGMKKRVAIARAIAMNPKYLFCDEPNSGLDPQTSIVIDNLIREITLEYNMTTVVISHDMNSVMEISDNIFFIFSGQKWWEGKRNDLLKADNKELCDFVYASTFMKEFKDFRK
ncbi:MAG: ATP-binding cassette domain-containing protein [Bacteroidetes bacterium]|nr:ATP-binding cassette domain-containing protein [Bacteroidota bacterium]